MNIDYIKNIKSKEEFVNFLKELKEDFTKNAEEWENTSLSDYFESISTFVEDYDFSNDGIRGKDDTIWSIIALIFYVGKIYE